MTEPDVQTNGRSPNGLIEVTLPDSGKVLRVRRVPVFLMREVQKSVKRPTPPLVEVTYETGPRLEPNRADPEYLTAIEEYGMALGEKMIRLVIKRGVECDVDVAALAELRADMEEIGIELPSDDRYVYVTYICCETPADLEALQSAVLRQTQPTEEAVGEALERFRGEVQG
jgi:hypothetical protein